MLLVREHAHVVNHLEGESVVAPLTELWLRDLSTLDVLVDFELALGASEASLFHLGGGVGGSDDDTLEGDELVNVRWVKLTDLVNLPKVEWPNLDNLLPNVLVWNSGPLSIIVVVLSVVNNILLVHLHSYEIENRNDICWIIFELPVKGSVELKYVIAVDIEGVFLSFSDFLELTDVVRLLVEIGILLHIEILVFIVDDGESGEELLELLLEVIRVNIGSPEDLGVRAHLITIVAEHLPVEYGATQVGSLLLSTRVEGGSVEETRCVEESSLPHEIGHLARGIEDTKMAEK